MEIILQRAKKYSWKANDFPPYFFVNLTLCPVDESYIYDKKNDTIYHENIIITHFESCHLQPSQMELADETKKPLFIILVESVL
jgi:hypothetical protein